MRFVPRKINLFKLPTKCDVIQYLLFLRAKANKRNFGLSKYFNEVISVVLDIWKSAKIPVKCRQVIRKNLTLLTKRYREVIKTPSFYNSNEWDKLFSVAACKCTLKKNFVVFVLLISKYH